MKEVEINVASYVLVVFERISCCQHYFVDHFFVGSFGFKNPYIVQAELLSLTRFSWLASNQGQVIPLPMIC